MDQVTAGEIARTLGEPQHRVDHVLKTREHIRPTGRVGIIRLYPRESIDAVREELSAIATRRRHAIAS